jgi:hypothetical protein
MDILIFQSFLHDEGKVGRFGAVTIGVFTIVFKPFNGAVKRRLDEPDIFADSGQVRQFQGSAVLLDDIHQGNIVKQQFVVAYLKFPLWKLEGLLNQLAVTLH